MNNFFELFLQQLIATSIWEWVAVVLAITYLLLAIKENSWCWVAAFFSTAIYTILFFDVNLYMESLLNIYYLVMAIYGWFQWQNKSLNIEVKPVISWTIKTHLSIITVTLSIVIISGWLLSQFTDQDYAYIDSLTTWFAVITTYMVTQKVLENWLYWLVIDSVSIYLYVQKGFALTSILFASYLVLALIGWLKWKQHYQKQCER